MRHYHNLLYVSHGTADETEGLKQALSLARNNEAPLTVLVICPKFPDNIPDYRQKYEASLIEQTEASINATREALSLSESQLSISIQLESDDTPDIRIIQQVIQHGYDLVIKEAEPANAAGGFKAIDMALLRKCPAALWLSRPISHSRKQMNIAVAVDPENEDKPARDLSKRLLELSRSLADSCSGTLHIVSCWDYKAERYLRGNSWMKVSDEEIDQQIKAVQAQHRTKLDALIAETEIRGAQQVHHLHGQPDQMIPQFVGQQGVDVMVMGTVARTGISGFIFGNTAENIVQQLSCSLIALKPHGFVSPVKAY